MSAAGEPAIISQSILDRAKRAGISGKRDRCPKCYYRPPGPYTTTLTGAAAEEEAGGTPPICPVRKARKGEKVVAVAADESEVKGIVYLRRWPGRST